MADTEPQLLHLVFGGELTDLDGTVFRDPATLDIVGIFPNYAAAETRLAGQGTVDRRQCDDALLHRPSAPLPRPDVRGLGGTPSPAGRRCGGTAADGRC